MGVRESAPRVEATDGFDAVYREHRTAAVQLAWLLTHDPVAAEDVAHDAFVALYRAFDRVDEPAAYLRRCVVHAAYERTRRRTREQRRHELVVAGEPTAVDGPTGGLADVVATLPFDQRVAVVLRYWGGLQHDEIAAAMGVRPGTARSHLSRATARLRKELS